jgi:thioredoxin-dependent peroxiredoxin
LVTPESLRGKWLMLYFYPKDEAPACTEEACSFRDDLAQLTRLGARVVAASVDDNVPHAELAAQLFSVNISRQFH